MPEQNRDVIYFKDAESALEYSSKHGFSEVQERQPCVAIVEHVSGQSTGLQSAFLRVAGHNDYFHVVATTAVESVPSLHVGDLVCWLPIRFDAFGTKSADPRTHWFGVIVGVLEPALIVATDSYRVKIDYSSFVRQEPTTQAGQPIFPKPSTTTDKVRQPEEASKPIPADQPRLKGVTKSLLGLAFVLIALLVAGGLYYLSQRH